MRSPPPRRRWLVAGTGLLLLTGLAVPLARRVAARMVATPAPDARLPDGAGARLERAMRCQGLLRAERTAEMLWRLEADRPEEPR